MTGTRRTALTAVNEEWHTRNGIQKNPSLDQRIDWHLRHQENCECRPIPRGIKAEIKKEKLGRSRYAP
ncbi:MAG TPA: hypothetical protein VFE98_09305 [Candidatus Bathyarchaeia archaeon]|nr:hypothetical protein [Candidatus Bathyarchaeia archaeon]